jgi:hypothetical protein
MMLVESVYELGMRIFRSLLGMCTDLSHHIDTAVKQSTVGSPRYLTCMYVHMISSSYLVSGSC